MPFQRTGLQTKIIIIIAVAVISVVAVSTSIAMLLTRPLVEEQIYRKALAQARAAAHQLADDEAIENPQGISKVLKQMERDLPGFKDAEVFAHEPQHHLLASSEPGGPHMELDNISGIESYFEFERPEQDAITIETPDGKSWIMGTTIREQGRAVGCLNVKVSKHQTSILTRSLVARNLLVLLAGLLAVSGVVHVFFFRRVRQPIHEMIRVMETTENGELSVRAKVRSRDEIGELAEHLNRMLAQVEGFNAELAKKVQEATAELAQRNEELRRINEELFEAQKSLARSERLAVAGQLAASLAHEIGTPLNSLSGHVQLLARRKTWDEASERRLAIIEKQIENMVRTVKQLLSWTRKFDLHLEPVELRRILEEAVLLTSPALGLRRIKVKTEFAPDCPRVVADSGYLHQVFLNLINNSMDAMPHGGGLDIRLRYPVNGERGEVAVQVADTGTGMSPETLAHIFDPMFTTKKLGTGAGLGLAICDQIIRQHSGAIQVASEVGHGTCFTVVLPVDCREKSERASAVMQAPSATA